MNRGVWYGLVAYLSWGLFPIYWKQLSHIESFQVIAHRVVWSFFFLTLVQLGRNFFQPGSVRFPTAKEFRTYSLAGLLIGLNWLLYIWAVSAGRIVESSLGYFINPLVNVLFGMLFFGEKLRPGQWLSLAFAFAGVLYLSLALDSVPWIALVLAVSFAAYGVVKKRSPLDPISGLTLETSLLSLPALFFLLLREHEDSGAFLHTSPADGLFLVGAGLVTSLPLLFFAAAARRVSLTTIGVLQYLSPSLQFMCGVWLYHEPFTHRQMIGFGLVWTGLAFFLAEGLWKSRK